MWVLVNALLMETDASCQQGGGLYGLWFFNVWRKVPHFSDGVLYARNRDAAQSQFTNTNTLRLPALLKNMYYIIHIFGLGFCISNALSLQDAF